MILSCPACQTCYVVDDNELSRGPGRNVRCANCGHVWHQPPLDRRANDDLIEPKGRIEPALELPPRPGGMPAPSLELPPRPGPSSDPPSRGERSRWAAARWLFVVVLCALAILAGVVVARGAVVAIWPPAARLYGLAGLPAERSAATLKVGKLTPTRTADGLIIEGDIVNAGNATQDLPQLRVALRDGADKDVQIKTIDPPMTRLAPGASVHFKTPFDHPDRAAVDVTVTFIRH
jgi:predicted Zn finger-like uncharacterized protein